VTPGDYDQVEGLYEEMSPENLRLRFFAASRRSARLAADRACAPARPGYRALLAETQGRVIKDVLQRALWLAPRGIDVAVVEGVVTLTGHMERKSETEIALSMTRRIDGVVGVVDRLTYRLDDARLRTQEQALQGVADDWLRRL
jgi:hypothetical protein